MQEITYCADDIIVTFKNSLDGVHPSIRDGKGINFGLGCPRLRKLPAIKPAINPIKAP